MVEMEGRSEWSVGMYEKMAVCRIPAAWEGGVFHVWRQRRGDLRGGGIMISRKQKKAPSLRRRKDRAFKI